jgi:hypothetical protein
LSRSHSCIVLAVCLGLFSCCKVNHRPSLRSWVLKDLSVLCSVHLSLDPD